MDGSGKIRIGHVEPRRRGFALVAVQCALLLTGSAMLALAPPARGPMLLLPVSAGAGEAINLSLAQGARLIGRGAFRGSVVVDGDRAAILPALLRHGTIVLAASPVLCGDLQAAAGGQAI